VLGLTRYGREKPGSLPFGIQKRVDIARALATRPALVVMDEPFSGLDLNEQEQLHDLIVRFREAGISVLLVDHAVQEVLSLADRVYVLDYGRLIAQGTPPEIRRSDAVKEAYFGKVEVSA
jgi:branched-chain amino acid transport system ATP-binding protein